MTTQQVSIPGASILRADDRGATRLNWLDSRHSFSFGRYRDPQRMGHSALRVINDDVIAPGAGFAEHPHNDMEIITFVLDGALEHRDSSGARGVLRAGDAQVMSAGTGIRHSETNASDTDSLHLIQIWVEPDRPGHEPRHDQLDAGERKPDEWRTIASGKGDPGALRINQDASIAVADLAEGAAIEAQIPASRPGYLHVATGAVEMEGLTLSAGDALEFDAGAALTLRAAQPSILLLFDLPPIANPS